MVPICERLAHFAGLAYGDGYPGWGEVRVVTYDERFAIKLVNMVEQIAADFKATFREYVRPGTVSDSLQHCVALNSTLVRRALFDDQMHPRYDAIHDLAMEENLAPHFQAGLSDAESALLRPVFIESPHGRVFAVINSVRRLLGIARLSMVNKLRLEPTSIRTRLASRKGRRHMLRGVEFVTRKNGYLIEVLSGAKEEVAGQGRFTVVASGKVRNCQIASSNVFFCEVGEDWVNISCQSVFPKAQIPLRSV